MTFARGALAKWVCPKIAPMAILVPMTFVMPLPGPAITCSTQPLAVMGMLAPQVISAQVVYANLASLHSLAMTTSRALITCATPVGVITPTMVPTFVMIVTHVLHRIIV
jgi:hypothetical protein